MNPYLIMPGIFLIDIFCSALLEQHLIHGLLCLAILQLLHQRSVLLITITTSGLFFEFFFHYGHLMPSCVALAPLLIISLTIRHLFYPGKIQPYLILGGYLIGKTLFLEPFFFQAGSSMLYTTMQLFANLGVMLLMSWNTKIGGKLGNRLWEETLIRGKSGLPTNKIP